MKKTLLTMLVITMALYATIAYADFGPIKTLKPYNPVGKPVIIYIPPTPKK